MENIMKEDFREVGKHDAERLISTMESFGTAPLDLVEYAYGLYEYFCEYLGFTQEAEGSTEAWDDWKQVEEEDYNLHKDDAWFHIDDEDEDEGPAIKVYCPAHSGRVELIQLADALVREFGQDFPYDPTEEVMPAPLAYWFREGVPSTLTFDWGWLAAYCYGEIIDAYKMVRECWLPDLPELAWDEV